jgi:hypothetical protein
MNSRDFAFWLQGFFELADPHTMGSTETEMIKRHLALVFVHDTDPSMGPKEQQDKLNAIHSNKFPTTEEEAVAKWGPKPSPAHKFNMHGWYDPKEGVPRC